MDSTYCAYFNEQEAGTVTVRKQGLYYLFSARCMNISCDICRLEVVCGDRRVNLGICIPENGLLTLKARLPMKNIGEGEMRFYLRTNRKPLQFHPVFEDREFMHLDKLRDAKFCFQDGQPGITIPNSEKDQPDSDRNP